MVSDLRCKGASVEVVSGRLHVAAPPGILTTEIQEDLRSLVEQLRGQPETEIRRILNGEGPHDETLSSDPILETRHELGAVLIRSRRFACELWVALDPGMAAELRAEESQRPEPRPVLLPEDVAALRGKSEALIRTTLTAMAVSAVKASRKGRIRNSWR